LMRAQIEHLAKQNKISLDGVGSIPNL